jgi:hypothetical protein
VAESIMVYFNLTGNAKVRVEDGNAHNGFGLGVVGIFEKRLPTTEAQYCFKN